MMKDKPQDYMRLGIVHAMIFPQARKNSRIYYSTLERLADDPYFTGVEVGFPPDGDYPRAKKFLTHFQKSVTYTAHPITLNERYDLGNPDEKSRKEAVKRVCEEIDKAHLLGIRRVGITSGKEVEGPEREERKEKLIASLREICRYAADKKLRTEVLLETFDFNVEKRRMLGPSQEAARVADLLSRDFTNFGILLDLSHVPLLGEDIATSVKLVSSYLRHVHIGNCVIKDTEHPVYGDQHPRFGIQGGEIGVKELRRFLVTCFECGYLNERKKAFVSFEVKPSSGDSSEGVIKNAQSTLQEAWEGL